MSQDGKQQRRDADSPDMVERFVGMLFGKGALETREPFGMKRLSAEARCNVSLWSAHCHISVGWQLRSRCGALCTYCLRCNRNLQA